MVAQRLRFADSPKGITLNVSNQAVDSLKNLAVLLLPVEMILPRFLGKDHSHGARLCCAADSRFLPSRSPPHPAGQARGPWPAPSRRNAGWALGCGCALDQTRPAPHTSARNPCFRDGWLNWRRRCALQPALVKDVLVMQRLPNFAIEHIMVVVNSPSRELRHPRAAQELIEEGRQQGKPVTKRRRPSASSPAAGAAGGSGAGPAGFQRCRGFGRLAGGARRLSQA